jgi:hypothetical protein
MDFEQHRRAIGNDVSHTQMEAALARVAGISERRDSHWTVGDCRQRAGPFQRSIHPSLRRRIPVEPLASNAWSSSSRTCISRLG